MGGKSSKPGTGDQPVPKSRSLDGTGHARFDTTMTTAWRNADPANGFGSLSSSGNSRASKEPSLSRSLDRSHHSQKRRPKSEDMTHSVGRSQKMPLDEVDEDREIARQHRERARKDSDPFSNFRNITSLRDAKEAKENRSPPKPRLLPNPHPRHYTNERELPKRESGMMHFSPPRHRKKQISPVKKAPVKRRSPSPERRLSDVSTLELSHSPEHFKKLQERALWIWDRVEEFCRGLFITQKFMRPRRVFLQDDIETGHRVSTPPKPKPPSAASVKDPPRFSKSLSNGAFYGSKSNHHGRSKSSSPPVHRNQVKPAGHKSPTKKVTRPPHRRHQELSTNESRVSKSFTDIATVKSANPSVDSAASTNSNFGERSKIEKFRDKHDSLHSANLDQPRFLKNQFHDQRVTGIDSYETAKQQLSSDDWELEVKGIEMIVSISRQKPELLRADIKNVARLMITALKNLRSQVARAAGQAYGELYYNLGSAMEGAELDKTVALLLAKTADTNNFIKESCNEALDVMSEQVSAYRAIQTTFAGGFAHKSVLVRTCVARIMDNIVTQLGAERVMGCSREFHELLFQQGTKYLSDANPDVRKHSRHCFGELAHHKKFDTMLKNFLKDNERRDVKKTLNVT